LPARVLTGLRLAAFAEFKDTAATSHPRMNGPAAVPTPVDPVVEPWPVRPSGVGQGRAELPAGGDAELGEHLCGGATRPCAA
jgi:hypothetical protein